MLFPIWWRPSTPSGEMIWPRLKAARAVVLLPEGEKTAGYEVLSRFTRSICWKVSLTAVHA